MHLLLFVSIVAALFCTGESNEFSDCQDQSTVVDGCATHLKYMEDASALKQVADLDDPLVLIGINNMCNDTMHLKMYYTCVYTNLTTCLQDANSTQVNNIPDASVIAEGIVKMCEGVKEINKTCVMDKKAEMTACVAEYEKKKETLPETCPVYVELYSCAEELDMCDGAEVIREFINSARPHGCDDISAATQSVTAISVLLVTLVCSLLVSL